MTQLRWCVLLLVGVLVAFLPAGCSFEPAGLDPVASDAAPRDARDPGDGPVRPVDAGRDASDECAPACLLAGGTCAGDVCHIMCGSFACGSPVVCPAGMK